MYVFWHLLSLEIKSPTLNPCPGILRFNLKQYKQDTTTFKILLIWRSSYLDTGLAAPDTCLSS